VHAGASPQTPGKLYALAHGFDAIAARSKDVYGRKDGLALPIEDVSSSLREGGTIMGPWWRFRI
jgi:hypothetical protein